MANNKVQLSNGTVIIDLTADTVTSASHIKSGLVAHLRDGSTTTGTLIEKDVKNVSYNLTNGVTTSISTTEVVTGQGYSVKLTAPAGYNLSNVTVTMGGIDITDQVFTPDEQGGGSGETYIRTEICPQQSFTGDSSQRRATLTGVTEGFTDGDYYIVTYDGVEWLTTCNEVWTNNFTIGETQWFFSTGNAVYPFGIIWGLNTTATIAVGDTSQHTVKIEHLEFVDDGIDLGTKTITQNGTYNASSDSKDGYSSVTVNVPSSGTDTSDATLTSGDQMLEDVTAYANGVKYTGTIVECDSDDISFGYSAGQVRVLKGYYPSTYLKSIPTGTEGTPTATKGTVSNHAVTVTPSVTNSAGYISGGTKTGTGVTVSASELVSGSETKTANGTYDVTNLASLVVNVSSGGGASNVVIGEFTTGSTAGSVESISIPYTGSGFPLACMVYIAGGAYNNTSTGNTTWYNSKQRYAVGQWTYHNAEQSSSCVKGVVTGIYKNSTSNATSYSRTSSMTLTVRTSSAPNQSATGCVNITQDNKTLRWLVASTSYGLLANTKYTYIMIYSE